jgi:anti-sigma B factor antagonist
MGGFGTGGTMSLRIEKRLRGDVIVIGLNGNITLGEASGALRDAVKETAAAGNKKILLDLGGVAYIDSAGLGELVGSYATCERAGAKLKLLNLTKKVEGLMQMTRLLTVFESFDDEAEAVKSYGSEAAARV